MDQLHALTRQLAQQTDRKLLQLEEEDHLRLDLSAHEKVEWKLPRKRSSFKGLKRFALSALGIYALLFSVTNMEAYGKIAFTNIQSAWHSYEDSRPVEPAQRLEMDPWTGERHAEELLETEEVFVQAQSKDYLPALTTPVTYENRIEIPSLGINAPIVEPTLGLSAVQNQDWEALEEQIHTALTEGVVHFPGTAEPGEQGNAFLTGHSSNVFWQQSEYNTVFALLPKIKVGDQILITYHQTQYVYTVTEMKEVSPKDVSVLKQGDDKQLTLVTCTPVGTALRRLVVTAELTK